MSPLLLLIALVAGLLALLPVWRLHQAGWPARTLLTAWVVYWVAIFVGMRFPGPFRLLLRSSSWRTSRRSWPGRSAWRGSSASAARSRA
jgi:hypothetical protein